MATTAVVLCSGNALPPPWQADLPGARRMLSTELETPGARAALHAAGALLVDAAEPDPVSLVRRVHRLEPALQAVLVAAPAQRERLQRAVLFAPGLGEVWMVAPAEVDPTLLARAAEVSRRRRSYQGTRNRIAHELASMEPHPAKRALISDAYLAALLEVSPDPVLSVDATGVVLSWNPGAERVLGFLRAEAVGSPLAELISPPGDACIARELRLTRDRARYADVHFLRRGGEEGIAEMAIVPVHAAGHEVRAVMLHDVTHERRTQRELETQAAQMESLNQALVERTRELERALAARSRFYASMSHELRTPINAILGYNALLLDEVYGPVSDPQRGGLQRVQRAAGHLLELVNDVLDLAKIEAGRVELRLEATSFPALPAELLDTVRSLADQHGCTLELQGPDGPHTVETDPRRVRQVLLNLISNAIKFGQARPVILRWRPRPDGGVEVEVEDHGPGIEPQDLNHIFEEFTQLDNSPPREGTGLGLSISRHLADALGGALDAHSVPGRGSTFRLILPPRVPELPDGAA